MIPSIPVKTLLLTFLLVSKTSTAVATNVNEESKRGANLRFKESLRAMNLIPTIDHVCPKDIVDTPKQVVDCLIASEAPLRVNPCLAVNSINFVNEYPDVPTSGSPYEETNGLYQGLVDPFTYEQKSEANQGAAFAWIKQSYTIHQLLKSKASGETPNDFIRILNEDIGFDLFIGSYEYLFWDQCKLQDMRPEISIQPLTLSFMQHWIAKNFQGKHNHISESTWHGLIDIYMDVGVPPIAYNALKNVGDPDKVKKLELLNSGNVYNTMECFRDFFKMGQFTFDIPYALRIALDKCIDGSPLWSGVGYGYTVAGGYSSPEVAIPNAISIKEFRDEYGAIGFCASANETHGDFMGKC